MGLRGPITGKKSDVENKLLSMALALGLMKLDCTGDKANHIPHRL